MKRRWRVTRTIAGPVVAGAAITMILAWPVPLVLLRLGWERHDMSRVGPWSSPGGVSCSALASRQRFSDAYSLRTMTSRDSFIPMGQSARLPAWVRSPGAGDAPRRVDTGATGWPFRALGSESWQELDTTAGKWNEELRWNLVIYTGSSGRIMLPFRPLWRGLVGDVVVFGTAWKALFVFAGMTRGLVRRRRGRCPKCGYDLGGTDRGLPCPECGTTQRG